MPHAVPSPALIVRRFNDCIADRDLAGLSDLMSEDHLFVDSAGGTVAGRENCVAAWKGFFAAFPDYRNRFERVEERDGFVAVAGRSDCADRRLAGPALWKAVLAGNRLAEWHVLEDTEENRSILGLSP